MYIIFFILSQVYLCNVDEALDKIQIEREYNKNLLQFVLELSKPTIKNI